MTSDMRVFASGMGHQVHEPSWGAWLVQIGLELLICRCIGMNEISLESCVESFRWFL
jgi:hypothetical protein